MPRPCKRRRICALPGWGRFAPAGGNESGGSPVTMTLDEFESIRLIDLEKLTQEGCAERMNVARTTVQAIYNSARVKLAECLVQGRELNIEGGEYVLCDGSAESCGYGRRCRRRRGENQNGDEET